MMYLCYNADHMAHLEEQAEPEQLHLDLLDAVLSTLDSLPTLLFESSHMMCFVRSIQVAIDVQTAQPLEDIDQLYDICVRHGWNGRQFEGGPFNTARLRKDIKSCRDFLARYMSPIQ